MSYIKRVEGWRNDVKAKIERFGADTNYGLQLQETLRMYDKLLDEMRESHKPKQASLAIREPGED